MMTSRDNNRRCINRQFVLSSVVDFKTQYYSLLRPSGISLTCASKLDYPYSRPQTNKYYDAWAPE